MVTSGGSLNLIGSDEMGTNLTTAAFIAATLVL
jgi:hypothetical protein